MPKRTLPLLAVVLALGLPSGASASIQHFGTVSHGSDSLSPTQTLRKAEAVAAGRNSGRGYELTPLLKDLAVKLPALNGSDRSRGRRLLARPPQGESAATGGACPPPHAHPPLCSAHFCILWVDSTVDAPPSMSY